MKRLLELIGEKDGTTFFSMDSSFSDVLYHHN